jgi:hypothetical protein
MTDGLPRRDPAGRRGRGRGQGLAEYAVILALVALFVLAGLLLLGLHFGDQVSLATPAPSALPSAGPSFVVASPTG